MAGAMRVPSGFMLGCGFSGTGQLVIFHVFNHVTMDNVQPLVSTFLSLSLFNSILYRKQKFLTYSLH